MSKKTSIIYCRVSTTKQQNDGDSLSNQEKACRNYCKNNNLLVVGVFKEAFTGKKKSRPIFDEAINNAKENKIDYFVIFDIDRFSREGYGAYSDLKNNLKLFGTELRDSKNIIQGSRTVIENDIVDMQQYSWNMENSSEYAEVMMSTQAHIEGRKIIQRTIPREIELEQLGYKVRQANFGYLNKKVRKDFGKATIQVKHPIEGEWIQEMFKKRADGNLTDEEIVDDINNKGYLSKRGKKLTVKQMQYYIKSLIYAGIIVSKWTGNKPIRTAYEGLISVTIWNKANRGKIRIIEIDSETVKVEYNSKNKTIINQPIIKNRKAYNPFYCYAKILKCPVCKGNLTGSTSKGRNGQPHYYYFCTGKGKGNKHKTYSLKRAEVHSTIIRTFRSLKIDDNVLKLYDKVIEKVYNERVKEIKSSKKDYKKHLSYLYKKENEILESVNKVINLPLLLEAKNKELENIKLEIIKLVSKNDESENLVSLEKFQYYCKTIIKHLDKLIVQEKRPDLISLIFSIVYGGSIEYEKIISQTTNSPLVASSLKQKKSSKMENFSKNLKWQSH